MWGNGPHRFGGVQGGNEMTEIEARENERVAVLNWDSIPAWEKINGVPRQNPLWVKAWAKVLESKAMVILAGRKGV